MSKDQYNGLILKCDNFYIKAGIIKKYQDMCKGLAQDYSNIPKTKIRDCYVVLDSYNEIRLYHPSNVYGQFQEVNLFDFIKKIKTNTKTKV